MTLHHRTNTHHPSSQIMAIPTVREVSREVQDIGPTKQHLHNNLRHSHLHRRRHLHLHQHQQHSHRHQQRHQWHYHRLEPHNHHKGPSIHHRPHNTTVNKANQVITPLTTQGILSEDVTKVIVAAGEEEITEVAEVDMETLTTSEHAIYVKMTLNIIMIQYVAQTFLQLH